MGFIRTPMYCIAMPRPDKRLNSDWDYVRVAERIDSWTLITIRWLTDFHDSPQFALLAGTQMGFLLLKLDEEQGPLDPEKEFDLKHIERTPQYIELNSNRLIPISISRVQQMAWNGLDPSPSGVHVRRSRHGHSGD